MRALRPYLVFTIVFIVSRVGFYAAGLRFSTEHVGEMMHFLPPSLLQDDLARSLLYMHSQPPLMSVFMGLTMKLFPGHYEFAFASVFALIGLGFGWIQMALFERLRFPARIGLAVACAYALLPQTVVFEHYFFFTHILAFLMLASALLLARALERPTGPRWLSFFLLIAVIVNFKSAFHLIWMVLLGVAAFVCLPRVKHRTVAVALALPLLLGGAWYAKNLVMFGHFQSSSWMGFALAFKSYRGIPVSERRRRAQRGELAPVTAANIYGGVDEYARALGVDLARDRTDVPLLEMKRKASGQHNFHHRIYIEANQAIAAEAWRLIRSDPGPYLEDVRKSLRYFGKPATDYRPVNTPYRQIQRYCDAVNTLLHDRWGGYGLCLWTLMMLSCMVFMVPRLIAFARAPRSQSVEDLVYIYMALTALYVYVLLIFLDSGETHRQRMVVDPFIVTCFALDLRRLWRRRARRRAPAQTSDSAPEPSPT
ncbi:hypothetical protein [Haliangium sp.]|uniref:hypothetical protein n=1 Tax=Haliangium sp. TaxID=2663208 RepID=UPI003D10632F